MYGAAIPTPHFATWLAGVVLPALDDRVRLDLVPLIDER
jgi:hypothetical protein